MFDRFSLTRRRLLQNAARLVVAAPAAKLAVACGAAPRVIEPSPYEQHVRHVLRYGKGKLTDAIQEAVYAIESSGRVTHRDQAGRALQFILSLNDKELQDLRGVQRENYVSEDLWGKEVQARFPHKTHHTYRAELFTGIPGEHRGSLNLVAKHSEHSDDYEWRTDDERKYFDDGPDGLLRMAIIIEDKSLRHSFNPVFHKEPPFKLVTRLRRTYDLEKGEVTIADERGGCKNPDYRYSRDITDWDIREVHNMYSRDLETFVDLYAEIAAAGIPLR